MDPPMSEASLVRLLLNALHGIKSALLVVEKLSTAFCLSPADRRSHLACNLWHRSSSSDAIGKLLKSIYHSGCVFYFLQKFVNYHLPANARLYADDATGNINPHTLVNQAFAAAVRKVLDGYIATFGTLAASVKLRRIPESTDIVDPFGNVGIQFEITLLEVYLHTRELEMHLGSLGTICFPDVPDLEMLVLSREDFVDAELRRFPRGADLLTYLYVQLRNADPIRYELHRFLLVRTFEPYSGFIKSWIYHAKISDPYEEFFVKCSDDLLILNTGGSFNELASLQEGQYVSVPCFLKDVQRPLLRAGQQLQVLLKLLSVYNCAFNEHSIYARASASCHLANYESILPCWGGTFCDSTFSVYSLAFDRRQLKSVMHKRETMYNTMLENLGSFFKQLDIRCRKMNYNVTTKLSTLFSELRGVTSPVLSPFSNDEGTEDLFADQNNSGADSSCGESSYNVDPFSSSECSSLSGSEGNAPNNGDSDLPDVVSQPVDSLMSILTSNLSKSNSYHHDNPSLISSHNNHEDAVPLKLPFLQCNEGEKHQSPTYTKSWGTDFGHPTYSQSQHSESSGVGYLFGSSWLGEFESIPCFTNGKYAAPKSSVQVVDGDVESVEGGKLYFHRMFAACDTDFEQTHKFNLMDGTDRNLFPSCIYNLTENLGSHELGVNPFLSKAKWLRTVRQLREEKSSDGMGTFGCLFDFSSIADPCKVYLESGSDAYLAGASCSCSPSIIEKDNSQNNEKDNAAQSVRCLPIQQSIPLRNGTERATGGADWEGLLKYSCEDVGPGLNDSRQDSVASFEMPLDIVINKCIIQEILLQYNYVSVFTLKLFEEGFDLHEHFSVLRRYHFMELGDWADMFVSSLCAQKWLASGPEQQIAEIQRLLDMALERSTCGNDIYKDRLFVYRRDCSQGPSTASTKGICAFDYIGLGYRVEWPICAIVSPEALKVYTEIFSFLIQIRLAFLALADVWCYLKNLMHSPADGQLPLGQKKVLNLVIKTRQQMNHFVLMLQQYVHSQLSDVSWHTFQYSIKHRVKDMFDLEAVHMSYLDDALHICFLSLEAKPVAVVIMNILQSALDFSSCFTRSSLSYDDLASPRLISQVCNAKATFEDNLKDIFLIYMKSPKHRDFSVCRFWDYLNYNDYYSSTIGKKTNYFCL